MNKSLTNLLNTFRNLTPNLQKKREKEDRKNSAQKERTRFLLVWESSFGWRRRTSSGVLENVEGSPPNAELLASGGAPLTLGVMAPELVGSGRKEDGSNV